MSRYQRGYFEIGKLAFRPGFPLHAVQLDH